MWKLLSQQECIMREEWARVHGELDRWAGQGLTARFWVRDDDACKMSRPLARLHALAREYNITVGLAVIPGRLQPEILDFLGTARQNFFPMCHGWKHTNHGTRKKPGEFGDNRSFSIVHDDAVLAYNGFCEFFGSSKKVVFVPPYGCITEPLVDALPGIGFAAVSAGSSPLEARISRLVGKIWTPVIKIPIRSTVPRIDAQIDLIDWRRRTARDARSVAENLVGHLRLRRRGFLDVDRPIGLLTHHLDHDEQVWRSCGELVDSLRRHKSVTFLDVSQEVWLQNETVNAQV
jgi:hypothetical protein